MARFMTPAQAAALVEDGWTVACAGFVGAGHAEAVTAALETRFLETARPRDLTLLFSAGQGDRVNRGVNHFGHAGLVRRIIGGHWRSAPKLMALARDNAVEAYTLPQGVITHLYRAIASGQPGVLTRIGLNTFVDPRHGGGRVNEVVSGLPEPVALVTLEGQERLLYRSLPVHCAFLRATTADANGNLACEEEAFHHELLAIAQAARNSGGIVIAQVKRVVQRHAQLAQVRVPGILVDAIAVCPEEDWATHHSMTFGETFNPAYLTAGNGHALDTLAPVPFDVRKVVQRRAVQEIARRRPRVVNLGVGMPAGVGAVAHEEGITDFTLTVEAGPIGGVPADGLSFGAAAYPECVVDQPAQFDFYDGGGIDLAVLGMAELDREGNVNVSRFGEGGETLIAGVGGFINITQSAKSLVFVGTLTAGGLEVEARGGRLRIVKEGRVKKIVPRVSHLSFNGPYIADRGVPVTYITERAVFEMRDDRLTLVEIAPGIDLEREVLAQCATEIAVAHDLKRMDARLFDAAPMKGR